MSQEGRSVTVLKFSDATGHSHLSMEFSEEGSGSVRLFPALSGSGFVPRKEDLGRIDGVLSGIDAFSVKFEDLGRALLAKTLGKIGFHVDQKPRPKRYSRVSWPSTDNPEPSAGYQLIGVSPEVEALAKPNMRRMRLRRGGKEIGELLFTDYGRFARSKANEFGMEGFCRCRSGEDLPEIFAAAYRALGAEGKQYLIFGPEFADHLECVHSFPLWHMELESPPELDHRCHVATKADADLLAKLWSEYDDTPRQNTLRLISRRLMDPSFKFLLSEGGEGFSLLKFKVGAEGMLHDLFVTPSRQGEGAGDQLVRASLSMLSSRCVRVHLNTMSPRAFRLYTKYDFGIAYTDYCVALNQVIMSRARG